MHTVGLHVSSKFKVLTTQLTSPINCFATELEFDLKTATKCSCILQGPADVVHTEDDDEKSCKTAKSCGGGGSGV